MAEAVAHIERALELSPANIHVLIEATSTLPYAGRVEEALAAADKAIRLDPRITPTSRTSIKDAFFFARSLRGRSRWWRPFPRRAGAGSLGWRSRRARFSWADRGGRRGQGPIRRPTRRAVGRAVAEQRLFLCPAARAGFVRGRLSQARSSYLRDARGSRRDQHPQASAGLQQSPRADDRDISSEVISLGHH